MKTEQDATVVRKAFEKLFPVPEGMAWHHETQEYQVRAYRSDSAERIGFATYREKWHGFQAAHTLYAQPCATPADCVVVPRRPESERIEAGAKRLACYESDKTTWPDSFSPLQRAGMRNEAERVYLSMVNFDQAPSALPSAVLTSTGVTQ